MAYFTTILVASIMCLLCFRNNLLPKNLYLLIKNLYLFLFKWLQNYIKKRYAQHFSLNIIPLYTVFSCSYAFDIQKVCSICALLRCLCGEYAVLRFRLTILTKMPTPTNLIVSNAGSIFLPFLMDISYIIAIFAAVDMRRR